MRPASRMLSATSFGVFWRSAPSTRAIIRSRKLSPASAVTRTTIWSERTRVPPVTAERSPPDSRITGADSPVIADSSTLAIPSITSPSAGITSPAVTTISSPTRSAELATSSSVPSARRRRAIVSARILRRSSACALPRPSATASAKFANTTVNQSQAATSQANAVGSAIASAVTSTLPTSTTNRTGFRTIFLGSSFVTLSRPARSRMARSNSDRGSFRMVIATGAPGSGRGQAPGST